MTNTLVISETNTRNNIYHIHNTIDLRNKNEHSEWRIPPFERGPQDQEIEKSTHLDIAMYKNKSQIC